MTEQATTYELTTINDIFNKVPLDRIETCMKELTVLLIQAKAIEVTIKHGAENSGIDVDDKMIFKLPESHSWIDDYKGEISMDIASNGDKLGNITTQLIDQPTEKPEFYGIGDIEHLHRTKEDAVESWFDGLSEDDIKNPPKTVTIDTYTPRDVDDSNYVFDHAIENIIEGLDQDYGDPDNDCDYELSDNAKALYDAFKKQVCAEFLAWECKKTGSIEVILSDYIDAEDLVEPD